MSCFARGILVAIAALAACRSSDRIKNYACRPFAAAADRSAVAYLTDTELVVFAHGKRRVLNIRNTCLAPTLQVLSVAPGGGMVAGYGAESDLGQLFHNTNKPKTVTTSCMVDTVSGTERPVEQGGFNLVWRDNVARDVPDPIEHAWCSAVAVGARDVIACVDQTGRQVIAGDRRYAAANVGSVSGALLAADGRRFAYWGHTDEKVRRNRAVVIDLVTGATLATYDQSYVGGIIMVEVDPRGGDKLLVADWMEDDDGMHVGRVRRISRTGATEHEHETGAADGVYWTEPNSYWVGDRCGAEHVSM